MPDISRPAMWMKGQLLMLSPQNSPDILSVISLQALGFGATHCAALDGLTIGESGQQVALANLSARQAEALGILTSGTYGRTCSTSLNSADLQSSLENKLKLRLNTAGSTLYKMTWKASATPSGRSVSLLRASAHRTSDSGFTSWPTARTNDAEKRGQLADDPRNGLPMVAQLAGWPTTTTRDHKDTTGMATDAINSEAAIAFIECAL